MRFALTASVFSVLVLMGLAAAPLQAAPQVEVISERVNLRAAPAMDSEVVAQVARGQVLARREGIQGEWIEVTPPDHAILWVYAELITDDIVAVDDLRVRGGPGINYRAVGRMARGEKVTVLGRDGDWLRIRPPANSGLWIHTSLVKTLGAPAASVATAAVVAPVPSSPAPSPAPLPSAAPATPPVSPSSPPPVAPTTRPTLTAARPPPAPVEKWTPPPTAQAGRQVRYSGVVRPAGVTVWRQPSRYRLVTSDSLGRTVTRCYLVADDALLARHEAQQVTVSGLEYKVQGLRFPVVAVATLQRAAPPER